MERRYKKFSLLTLIISIFLLTGCNKLHFNTFDASKEDNISSEVTDETDITGTDNKEEETSDNNKAEVKSDINTKDDISKGDNSTLAIQPAENIELPIYSINVETGEIETITALISKDEKITPILVVDKVIESMKDRSVIVEVESVKTEGDAVIVNFNKVKAPYSDFGAGYEESILNAIAQSLVDNLDDHKNVIYRVEGKAYSSGHIELGIDEVYLGENY